MHIEHLAFNVADPPAMAAWYARNLGMEVLRHLTDGPLTHFLADRAGRVVLEFYRHTRAPIPDYAALDPLVLHIAFKVDDVARVRSELLAAGATSASEINVTPAGDELTFLRDPWGLALQLVKRASPLL
jgi:catechol 2,3-dioxygenase-like lactoylglutathione lyase family enzyme